MIGTEIFGWFTSILLWCSFFPKKRFYLHAIGLLASIGRLSYIVIIYFTKTGDLARPLIANWIVTVVIHIISLYRFRGDLQK